MGKKRLLVFHTTVARYRLDFFNALTRHFDSRVCLMFNNVPSQNYKHYDKVIESFEFEHYFLPKMFKLKGRQIHSGYWHQLNSFKPDIVVVGEFSYNCVITLLHRFLTRSKYKVVTICDDNKDMCIEGNDTPVHRHLRKWLMPIIDDIILLDTDVVNWYQENYRKGIFFPIMHNDVVARKGYERAMPLSEKTMAEYGLEGKYVFLYVGRLVKIKNVDMLLDAFSMLKDVNTALVIVGDGVEKDILKEKSKRLGVQVIFTGKLEADDVSKWYNIANCLVLPSVKEPYGATTNEALLAGCKCIVSNIAGSRCLIENGKNGYIFNPEDVNELVGKMKTVMEEDCASPIHGLNIRNSRMLIDFDERMENLVDHLYELTKQQHND